MFWVFIRFQGENKLYRHKNLFFLVFTCVLVGKIVALCSGAPRIWQKRGHSFWGLGWTSCLRRLRGSGGVATIRFLLFSHKNTRFSTFFIEKGHAMSAVTMDNAKIFLQRKSKSRSLAKISERRLQPLVVWEIINWKLGFGTLLLSQRGRHGTVLRLSPPCVRLWLYERENSSSTNVKVLWGHTHPFWKGAIM